MASGAVLESNLNGIGASLDGRPLKPTHVPTNGVSPTPSFKGVCADVEKKISNFLEEYVEDELLKSVQKQTRDSLAIIQESLLRYPLETLSLSYNGGKDCLLLLYLYLSLLANHPELPDSLPAIYIPHHSPFPTLDTFVEDSAHRYHLKVTRYEHRSMREAFRGYLDDEKTRRSTGRRRGEHKETGKPQENGCVTTTPVARDQDEGEGIQGILVGTRRTDPHGGSLQAFSPTDGGWPKFMRILPVLEWKYQEVWTFLRHLDIPYCELYDLGYTSLGGTNDTHPNPALRTGEGKYLPAYELRNDEEERLGREGGG